MGYGISTIGLGVLVERDSAIAQLNTTTERLLAGLGGIVLVSGEAGIGKTTLLEHYRQSLDTQQTLYWSGCDPLLTPRPLGPLYDIASRISKTIFSLLETGASPVSIFAALYDFLEKSNQPIILIFEDVHWANYATLDLFKFLGRRISFLNCLLIVSFREDEVDELHVLKSVIDVLPSAHTTRIKLSGLK